MLEIERERERGEGGIDEGGGVDAYCSNNDLQFAFAPAVERNGSQNCRQP